MIIRQQHARALHGARVESGGRGDHGATNSLWLGTFDTVKTNRCAARAQVRFFNSPCSRAYRISSALVFSAEVLHDRVFVKGHGARAYLENVRDFLHRTAFCEELQHFALARGKFLRGELGGSAEENTERHALGNERRDGGPARERPLEPVNSSPDAESSANSLARPG